MPSQPAPAHEESRDLLQRRIEEGEHRVRLLDAQIRVLERERQKLSAVVNNSDAGFIVLDSAQRIIWTNRAFEQIMGRPGSQGQFLGEACNRVLCGREQACEICPAAVAFRSGQVAHHEMKILGGGQPRLLYTTGLPIRSPDGHIEETVLMLQDVSDLEVLRRSQTALRASEERFRSIFEQAAAGMATIAPDGSFLQINEAFRRFLGYSEPELLRLGVLAVTYPDDREFTRRAFAEANAGHTPVIRAEKRYLTKAGSMVWGDLTAVWIYDSDGNPAYSIALVQDIGERKRAEAQLRAEKGLVQLLQDAAVAANEAETLPDAIRACLRRVCGHTGWPVGHALLPAPDGSGDLVCSGLWHLDDPDRFEAFVKSRSASRFRPAEGLPGGVLSTRRALWSRDATREGDFPRGAFGFPVMAGKDVVAVLEFFSPEPAEPDVRLLETVGHIGTQLGRVHERQRAAGALRDSEEQLRHAQKMEAVGRLAGGVAHDFNNLLTVIVGHSAQLLQQLGPDTPAGREADEIRRAGERAAGLTRQLLAFSRRQVLQPRVIDLNLVVSEMQEMLRRLIGARVELVTALGSRIGHVKADPGQIEQVIMNLVVNARDAIPEGGCITLQTSEETLAGVTDAQRTPVEPGRYVLLSVSDTGQGIQPEHVAHIFEPFFTTKEVGKGTGLGLSTVYGIVRQSGGYVVLDSGQGRPTTFRVYLPRVEPASTGVRLRPSAATSPAPGPAARERETILVVEDEVVVRELVRGVLERHGYQVLEALDAPDARLICERYEGTIHMMLTDVVMPLMSGVELASFLAPLRPGMKVLYMSGYTDEDLDTTHPFLHKPFTPDLLAARVRELLDSERTGR